MADIVCFHSVLGVREGIYQAQQRLRDMGHSVSICDQYAGKVFDDYALAHEFAMSIGYDELFKRALTAVESMQSGFIALGFSNGGAMAQLIATRYHLPGIICCSGLVPLEMIYASSWPQRTSVQIHYTQNDPLRRMEWFEQGIHQIRQAGSVVDYYEYPGLGHLFTDSSLTEEYQMQETEQLWDRVENFIDFLGHN